MRNKKKLFWIAPLAIVGMAAFIAVGGYLVMYLWNWLLPALFGWRIISFWQALGLLLLCRILVGGFGGGMHGPRRRRRMAYHWDDMSPEEHERFRKAVRNTFDPGTSATGPGGN